MLEPHFDIDIRYTSTLLPILFHISGSRASDMVEHPVYTSRKYPYSRLQRKGNREMFLKNRKHLGKMILIKKCISSLFRKLDLKIFMLIKKHVVYSQRPFRMTCNTLIGLQ